MEGKLSAALDLLFKKPRNID